MGLLLLCTKLQISEDITVTLDLPPPLIAASLLLASCMTTMDIPVPCILLVAMYFFNWRREREVWDGCSGPDDIHGLRMAHFTSGQWVGNLVICKNGGWALRPDVYCIVVGGKKQK
jgi:hypothetical protein